MEEVIAAKSRRKDMAVAAAVAAVLAAVFVAFCVLTAENVDSLGAAKQRLIELKTAEEIAGTPVRG